jgi:chromosome segregation ATPase
MGWFIFKIYKNQNEANAKLMADVQARCSAREERLNEQIEKCQEVNAKAIATISVYTERLGIVEQDVKDIKEMLISENR